MIWGISSLVKTNQKSFKSRKSEVLPVSTRNNVLSNGLLYRQSPHHLSCSSLSLDTFHTDNWHFSDLMIWKKCRKYDVRRWPYSSTKSEQFAWMMFDLTFPEKDILLLCWRRGWIPVTTSLLSSFCLCFLLNTHSGTKMILSPIKHYNNTNTGLSLRWGLSDNESLPWAAVTALFCNKISLGAVKSTPPPSAHPSILAEYRYPERYVCVGLSFSKWENKKCSS